MIDITKCIYCRKGISAFIKNDELYHFDFFATSDAGHIYKCENAKDVEPLLIENKNGILTPNSKLKYFLDKQSFWWEDITELLYEVFDNVDDIHEWMYGGDENKRMIDFSDKTIENALIVLAEKKDILINEEKYPDLIKFKNQ